MANNRYYMYCQCGRAKYLGKSFGTQITNWSEKSTNDFLSGIYEWMWKHLMNCPKPKDSCTEVLGPEWAKGEVFSVITEYDDRITIDSVDE